MKMSLKYREVIADARRVVVKIGSRVLVQKTGRPDVRRMKSLVKDLASLQKSGCEVAVVTSGAVGTGMEALGMKDRPKALPDLQMAAAVGQARLMSVYDDLFGAHGCKVGQVLLTHDDFHHKIRLTNARRVMENLLRHRVIPIINENDVVADEEIRADLALGDNDLLASLVVRMIRADLLIMLTTAAGVLARDEKDRAYRLRYIEAITPKILALTHGKGSNLSKGGMDSKLRAARTVSRAGCAVVIANGRESGILSSIIKGRDVGTLILPAGL